MMHAMRSAVRATRVATRVNVPVRTLAAPVRFNSQFSHVSTERLPADLPLRTSVEPGVMWADYRPEILRNITAKRNAEGDMVGQFQGEEVIFPDLEATLEWVLTTPVDLHLFEESPIIKMYEDETEVRAEMPGLNKH